MATALFSEDSNSFRVQVEDLVIENTPDAKIGSGSFGQVWRGMQRGFPCAVKILKGMNMFIPLPGDVNIEEVEKFRRECRILCDLKHPNIVQHFQTYYHPSGNPLLAMELLDGNLTNFLKRFTNPSMPDATLAKCIQVKICTDVASALCYLHSRPDKIVHRDLSSNNVLLSGTTCLSVCAKVSDFGISRLIDHEEFCKILSTAAPGTKAYMPPESWKFRGEYTEKFDIFSFGVLMLQTITMLPPDPSSRFDDLGRFVPEKKRREDHLSKISGHQFENLVCRCLQDDQYARPDAKEINGELDGMHGNDCSCDDFLNCNNSANFSVL